MRGRGENWRNHKCLPQILKSTHNMLHRLKSQWISKDIKIHALGTIDVYITFHSNLSYSCQNISQKNENVRNAKWWVMSVKSVGLILWGPWIHSIACCLISFCGPNLLLIFSFEAITKICCIHHRKHLQPWFSMNSVLWWRLECLHFVFSSSFCTVCGCYWYWLMHIKLHNDPQCCVFCT